jgi:hypothetical protein
MIADAVAAIPAKAQATGSLLAAALKPTDGRWENGLAWRSERCFAAAGFGVCDPTPDPVEPNPFNLESVYPQGYVIADECTTLGGDMDEARVRRQAEAVASFMVARELWTGTLTAANPATVDGSPYVNPSLDSGATVVASTATGVVARLAILEQTAMTSADGQQVFLHLPPHLVLGLGNLLRMVGDLLVTPLGNVIVADAGYPGSGPAGTGTEWAFATGPVGVRLTAIEVITDMAATLDRTTNRRKLWARREFAAAFDACTHFAIDTSATA